MALKKAAASKGKSKLAQRAKKRGEKMSINHPTEDSVTAPYHQVYNPPQPEDRFQFLKTFSTIPGLRNKGQNQQR